MQVSMKKFHDGIWLDIDDGACYIQTRIGFRIAVSPHPDTLIKNEKSR